MTKKINMMQNASNNTFTYKHTFFKYFILVHFVHRRRPFNQNKQKHNTKQNLQIHIDASEQVRQR